MRTGLLRLSPLLILLPVTDLHADTYWQANPNTIAEWSNPINWTPSIPGTKTRVFINNGGTASITSTVSASSIYLGYTANDSGFLAINNGTLTTGTEYVGYRGIGGISQSAGSNSAYSLQIANSDGLGNARAGSYFLSGGQLILSGPLALGTFFGTGTFTQAGGSVTANSLSVGDSYDGIGYYTLSQGSLSIQGTESMGWNGTATFLQSGGTNTCTTVNIGSPVDTTYPASYTLTGGTLQFTAGLWNAGTLTISGNTTLNGGGMVDLGQAALLDVSHLSLFVTVPNSLLILPANTSTAAFAGFGNPYNCSIHFAGTPIIIPAGTAIAGGGGGCSDLVVCSGTLTGTSRLNGGIVVQDPSANASCSFLNVNDASSGLTAGQLNVSRQLAIGLTSNGTFTQSGGTATLESIELGCISGMTGTYILSNGTLNAIAQELIGCGGMGAFIQSGGTHTGSNIVLGAAVGSISSYSLTNGVLNENGQEFIGDGQNTFSQSGGTNATGSLYINGQGIYSLSGGTLQVGSMIFYSYKGVTGTFNWTAGTLILEGGSISGATSLTVGGTLSGNGSIAAQVLPGSSPHTISPNSLIVGTAGTLTMTALTTNVHTTLAFNLLKPNFPGGSDTIVVSSVNGLTLNYGAIQIASSPIGASSLGYYRIIQYSGNILGSGISSLTLPTDPNPNIVYSFDLTHDPGFIDLHRGLVGDADDSGTVDFNDFLLLSQNFGKTGGWGQGNLNSDSTTDFNDFLILSQNFGKNITAFGGPADFSSLTPDQLAQFQSFGSTPPGVPEPASLALLLPATLLLRRRH